MNISSRRNTNEILAQFTFKNSLTNIFRLFVFIGKPFFKLLTLFTLALFSLLYITGHYIKEIYSQTPRLISNFSKRIPRGLKIKKHGVIFKTQPKPVSSLKNLVLKQIHKFGHILKGVKKTSVSIPDIYELILKFIKRLFSWTKKFFSLTFLRLRLILISIVRIIPKFRIGKKKLFKTLFIASISVFFLVVLSGVSFWYYILKDLPSPNTLTERRIDISTKIYDRNGILLYTIFDDKNRTPISLDEVPLQMRLATLAIEDADFYSHPGFSVRGITRAAINDIKKGELSGGSTITQQLVKNTLLSSEKTLVRKLREVALAVKVEMTYSKDTILEMYLNEVSYGGTAYGIQEAARMYFNKDVKDLTLGESALLSGLPKSPTEYSPFGSNPQASVGRKDEVLRLMRENGYITDIQQKEAVNEKIVFSKNRIDIKAPHFVMFVRQLLEEKYGKEVVEKGGLNVTTTLDYNIQKLAENAVSEEIDKLKALNVGNGAVIILSPLTGEILAMVGSRDYFDTENDGNVNVTTSLRQPGSSIKVINYAYALGNGYNAATVIPDSPVTFLIPNQDPYIPKNYEGGFRGNITVRSALAESRNIPAVRILNSYGVKKMIETGQNMGISTWNNPDNYGLSLTLGGGEVKLIDLAYVYATLANYGNKPDQKYVLKVTNSEDEILEANNCSGENSPSLVANVFATASAMSSEASTTSCSGTQVIDPRVAYIITDILKDNNARSPSFGGNSQLVIPNHKEVAVKTGTSNNLRDNLTVGYNQKYTVAVWVGNNNNSEMARIASGVTGASPIFNKIMSALLSNQEALEWKVPEKLVQLPICSITGTLACDGCPRKLEWFLEENQPKKYCSPDWFKKDEEVENKENEMENPDSKPEVQYQFFEDSQNKNSKPNSTN